jgi:hypothetical protein
MLELITRLWHLHFRLILSTALGTAVTLALLAVPWRTPTRILLGWDAGVALVRNFHCRPSSGGLITGPNLLTPQ